MKNIINIALILVILSTLAYSWREYSLVPCDTVLEYSIGRFDGNFGLKEDQFKNYITTAESVWEKPLAKNLFEYNPEAKFRVNLIYDERQRATVQKQRTESGLVAAEEFFKGLDAKFNAAKAEYDLKASLYNSAKNDLDAKMASYESKVNYWNSQGGASPAKYRELEAERAALNRETAQLNIEAQELNRLAEKLNLAVKDRNGAVGDYNKAVASYNERYGGHLEFNQAEYTGKDINVYQFTNSKSLIAALSHELGHALSMDHVENPNSIMYYLRESENIPSNLVPSPEDMLELDRVCKL